MKEITILDHGNTRDIIIYAFRYALGRMSMAPHSFTEWCTVNMHLVSLNDRRLMIREITEAEHDKALGMEGIDDVRWIKFRNLLENLVRDKK
jgi:hypothetical protein